MVYWSLLLPGKESQFLNIWEFCEPVVKLLSLKLTIVEVFVRWKSAHAKSQDFFFFNPGAGGHLAENHERWLLQGYLQFEIHRVERIIEICLYKMANEIFQLTFIKY